MVLRHLCTRRGASTFAARGIEGLLESPEHVQLRALARRIIDTDINPHVDAWEAQGKFPAKAVFKTLGAAGLLGITKPVAFGGLGLDYSFGLCFALELGRIRCGGVPMAIGVQTDMTTPALARFGSDALREQFLRPTISGDFVSCLGVSEVGAGSDVAAITTTARKDGDDYVINGGKMWTTNGTQADWMCLLVNTGAGPAHANKSLLCLPMTTPGVTVSRPLDKLGMRSSDTAQVFFEDVRVPQSYRIGDEGLGFKYQMLQFQEERLYAAASMLLTFDMILEDTAAYARSRPLFGQSVLHHQVVQFRLAELATEVELLRSLVYRAAGELMAGKDVTVLTSMAKLKVGRLARELTDACLQYYGGMGFMQETHVSRAYRDTRVISIGAGADEVMLSILARRLFFKK